MASIRIFTKKQCSFCENTKRLLDSKGLEYEEIDITNNAAEERALINVTGQKTVPQIFVDDDHIGGFSDFARRLAKGELNQLFHMA